MAAESERGSAYDTARAAISRGGSIALQSCSRMAWHGTTRQSVWGYYSRLGACEYEIDCFLFLLLLLLHALAAR